MITNSAKEAIRILDGKNSMIEYVKKKFPYHHDFIDLEAGKVFNNEAVTSSIIACSHGFNHHGLRDSMINKNDKGDDCLRCSQTKTWDHVVKYTKTIEMRRDFIFNLTKDLLKGKESQIEASEALDMVEDIINFLENGDAEDYETSQ